MWTKWRGIVLSIKFNMRWNDVYLIVHKSVFFFFTFSACDLSVHKACIDELDEPCRKQRGKSKFRNFRPTSTAGKTTLVNFKCALTITFALVY